MPQRGATKPRPAPISNLIAADPRALQTAIAQTAITQTAIAQTAIGQIGATGSHQRRCFPACSKSPRQALADPLTQSTSQPPYAAPVP